MPSVDTAGRYGYVIRSRESTPGPGMPSPGPQAISCLTHIPVPENLPNVLRYVPTLFAFSYMAGDSLPRSKKSVPKIPRYPDQAI